MSYIGNEALAQPQTYIGYNTFNGDALQVNFTIAETPLSKNHTFVYISGVYQAKTEYSIAGNVVTFTVAPPTGTNNVEIMVAKSLGGISNGDAFTNTGTSVDGELVLFSGTGGKTLKRATGTGIVTLSNGVLSTTAVTGAPGNLLYFAQFSAI